MIVKRVEKHIVDRQSKWYSMLKDKCMLARNVYNHGNYIIRQEFFNNGKYLGYNEVEKLLHDDTEYPDYWNLGLANSSQQILRSLDKNWKSFFRSIRDWKKHPKKYRGMPKPPKYLRGSRLKEFALTYAQISLKNDKIKFPKSMRIGKEDFIVDVRFSHLDGFIAFKQCRIIPANDRFVLEFVYTIEMPDRKVESGNIVGIDLGLDNFVTLVDNCGNRPLIINGKGLKSCNRYYNKLIACNKSKLDLQFDDKRYSHRLYSITNKRNDKIDYFMYKASSIVASYCVENDISAVIVGKNDGWKNEVNLGKVNNQKFVYIPYQSFISKLKYKCEQVGVSLIETEESYTSGTSFIDNESPNEINYNKKRRIKRGLFRSNNGKLINADVNAAFQIMKKVFRDVEIPTDIGFVMNPVRVNIVF